MTRIKKLLEFKLTRILVMTYFYGFVSSSLVLALGLEPDYSEPLSLRNGGAHELNLLISAPIVHLARIERLHRVYQIDTYHWIARLLQIGWVVRTNPLTLTHLAIMMLFNTAIFWH